MKSYKSKAPEPIGPIGVSNTVSMEDFANFNKEYAKSFNIKASRDLNQMSVTKELRGNRKNKMYSLIDQKAASSEGKRPRFT